MIDTPYKLARNIYSDDDWLKIMSICGENGVIHSDEDVFIAGYFAYSNILSQDYENQLDKPDTFFICIAAGKLCNAFDMIKRVEFVSFERFDEKIRIMEYEKFKRRCYGQWSDG